MNKKENEIKILSNQIDVLNQKVKVAILKHSSTIRQTQKIRRAEVRLSDWIDLHSNTSVAIN